VVAADEKPLGKAAKAIATGGAAAASAEH
jgi:hypothetical protein